MIQVEGTRTFTAKLDTKTSEHFCTHADTFEMRITGTMLDLMHLSIGLQSVNGDGPISAGRGKPELARLELCVDRLLQPGPELARLELCVDRLLQPGTDPTERSEQLARRPSTEDP